MLYQKEFLLKLFEETDISVRCQTFAEQQKRSDDVIVNLITKYAENQNWDGDTEPFRTLIAKRRVFPQNVSPQCQQLSDHLDTYEDIIARHVLDKVTVLDNEHLLVAFKGGITVKQAIKKEEIA